MLKKVLVALLPLLCLTACGGNGIREDFWDGDDDDRDERRHHRHDDDDYDHHRHHRDW